MFQSQMDEHFLYNTLNSIYCTATKEKAIQTADMVYMLSIFQVQLGKVMITVGEVEQTIKLYLSIQRFVLMIDWIIIYMWTMELRMCL